MPFSNRECRDNFSIYLINHIVDGQISKTRLANSRNMPFDKQCCMATNHWTSDQKGYNIKNKVLQFQKLNIINEVHIISNTLWKNPLKFHKCVNIKYGYIKSRYNTQYVSEQMSNRRMKTAKYENTALKK